MRARASPRGPPSWPPCSGYRGAPAFAHLSGHLTDTALTALTQSRNPITELQLLHHPDAVSRARQMHACAGLPLLPSLLTCCTVAHMGHLALGFLAESHRVGSPWVLGRAPWNGCPAQHRPGQMPWLPCRTHSSTATAANRSATPNEPLFKQQYTSPEAVLLAVPRQPPMGSAAPAGSHRHGGLCVTKPEQVAGLLMGCFTTAGWQRVPPEQPVAGTFSKHCFALRYRWDTRVRPHTTESVQCDKDTTEPVQCARTPQSLCSATRTPQSLCSAAVELAKRRASCCAALLRAASCSLVLCCHMPLLVHPADVRLRCVCACPARGLCRHCWRTTLLPMQLQRSSGWRIHTLLPPQKLLAGTCFPQALNQCTCSAAVGREGMRESLLWHRFSCCFSKAGCWSCPVESCKLEVHLRATEVLL